MEPAHADSDRRDQQSKKYKRPKQPCFSLRVMQPRHYIDNGCAHEKKNVLVSLAVGFLGDL